MTGRVGHGTGRTLDVPTCGQSPHATHDARASQIPDGTMTGGTQPTHIRGIDRRGKVPSTRHLQPPNTRAREPGYRTALDSVNPYQGLAVDAHEPTAWTTYHTWPLAASASTYVFRSVDP